MDAPLPGSAHARPAQAVLVVDDEPDVRESLEALLEACLPGVRVETAASGPEALALLAKEEFSLIISDYKMPAMDGIALLSQTSRIAPRAPRILVTAFPDVEVAIRAINEARIENFFTKPLDPQEILDVVQGLLQEKRAQHLREQAFARSQRLLSGRAEQTGR